MRRPHRRRFLLPFDRPRRIDPGRLAVVSRAAWLHSFRRLLLAAHPFGALRDHPSTLDVVPYQLEPALGMLRDGHARLLVADAVGLGKTIEAGLILRELAEQHEGFRALVLVPAGLRQQWADEMAGRLTLEITAADATWLRVSGRCLPPDVNPWSLPGIHIASFDFIKRPEALRPLEDVRWDLVVVDEAHAAAVATDRRAAVDAVASRAQRVILLTATPPSDAAEFAALCRIGADATEPDILMFQRGRPVRGPCDARRSVLLAVRLTASERRMHRLLERYTTLVWREAAARRNAGGRLASVVLRKRALSSPAALEASIRRRHELLAGAPAPPEMQLWLPLAADDEDAREDEVTDVVLGTSGLADEASEQRWLASVRNGAQAAAGDDSKARRLVRLLRRAREPAIVFTEFRDTLERLRVELLKAGLACCVLHGGLPAPDRRDVLSEFARGGTTLLATDAAAEGLNLQKTCRLIVHFELPWNPSRLLQRAGRVDRIGQSRRVHEIAFVAADTSEAMVLAPLTRRATGWLTAEGGGRMLELLTESRVAEAVFEGVSPEPPGAPPSDAPRAMADLTADGICEAARLNRRRGLLARQPPGARQVRPAVYVTVMRRSTLSPGVVLLFDLQTLASDGSAIERAPAAVHVALGRLAWPRKRSVIAGQIEGMLPALLRAVSGTLADLQHRQLNGVRPAFLQARGRSRQRARAVAGRRERAARQLVQGGLFDRRVVAHRHADRADPADRGDPSDEAGTCRFEEGEPDGLTVSAELTGVLVVPCR